MISVSVKCFVEKSWNILLRSGKKVWEKSGKKKIEKSGHPVGSIWAYLVISTIILA